MSEDTSSNARIDELFSRERLAGYSPEVLGKMTVVVIGGGAAGSNLMQSLSLLGVGELRIIDLDRIDPSNYARSPGFVDAPEGASKAQTLARASARQNPRLGAIVRYAHARIEDLGLGAFQGATLAVSALDSKEGRAFLASATRFLGIPLIEMGFRYPRLHVSVYGNRSDDAPCWRCREPEVTTDRVSCSLYAQRVVESGRTPATQPLAAVAGAFAAEACVRVAHGDMSFDDTFIEVDLRTFACERMSLAAAEDCPGVHRRPEAVVPIEIDHHASVDALLLSVAGTVSKPVLKLSSPYLVAAPCVNCGAKVGVGLPNRAVREAPACATCPEAKPKSPASLHELAEISFDDHLRKISLRRLGYRAADLVTVLDEADDRLHVFRLQGEPESLFHTITSRGLRSPTTPAIPHQGA